MCPPSIQYWSNSRPQSASTQGLHGARSGHRRPRRPTARERTLRRSLRSPLRPSAKHAGARAQWLDSGSLHGRTKQTGPHQLVAGTDLGHSRLLSARAPNLMSGQTTHGWRPHGRAGQFAGDVQRGAPQSSAGPATRELGCGRPGSSTCLQVDHPIGGGRHVDTLAEASRRGIRGQVDGLNIL
jgi:hypothetical protein